MPELSPGEANDLYPKQKLYGPELGRGSVYRLVCFRLDAQKSGFARRTRKCEGVANVGLPSKAGKPPNPNDAHYLAVLPTIAMDG